MSDPFLFASPLARQAARNLHRLEVLTANPLTPPGTFPLATWAGRLSDRNDRHRLAAHLAIHDWLVDMAGGGQRIASSEQRVAGSELPLATRHSLGKVFWNVRVGGGSRSRPYCFRTWRAR